MLSKHSRVASPCRILIFGASGDLTHRKLIPSLYNLECAGALDENFRIIGYSRTEMDNERFRSELKEAVVRYSRNTVTDETWSRFAEKLYYLSGQYDRPEDYVDLANLLTSMDPHCEVQHYLCYLALPPSAMEKVLETMQKVPFFRSTKEQPRFRIMVEKPFGLDLAGAKRLNRLLGSIFDEEHVYRIDHYIAKDTIRNLLVLRFANAFFEPVWNRNYIDNVQITAAEKIGIEGRGGYYDETGIVRDMVQNHVMQVLALIAMESPVAGYAESIQEQKLQVFKSLSPIQQGNYIFGQYRGYQQERGVRPGSKTPTFVALRMDINNWRWHGVPFYIRAGKALVRSLTEVVIQFKRVPLCVLDNPNLCPHVEPNRLVVRIQPDEGIHLTISAKSPEREDRIRPANLDFRYSQFGMQMPDAYERVILDGLKGDPTLFWRADGIEAAWKVMEPLLSLSEDHPPPFAYEPGTWGPEQGSDLLGKDGRVWLSV